MKSRFILWLSLSLIAGARAQVLPADATVDGRTIGDWSAEWWKWLLAIFELSPAERIQGSDEYRAN